MKKKTFDAVMIMREAREKLAVQWEGKPREEEVQTLRRKYAGLTEKKKRVRG
ncbi:MAG: hypothetical protein ACYC64_09360 [Armatimonadota bacterium]